MKKVRLILIVLISLACAFPPLLPAQTLDLEYSTYLGGSGSDSGRAIAVGTDLCAYLTGSTYSSDFPTTDCYQASGTGIFVTKFSSTGSSLIYSTYLGEGTVSEAGSGIALDSSNCAYVTGYTSSSDFPTKNAYQISKASFLWDAFVTKFSSSGSSLIYSTYLGGAGSAPANSIDEGYDIAVDSVLCAYVTGYTNSTSFPTLNPYQPSSAGYPDVFVTKFSSSGSSLLYSTYLGGYEADRGYAVALDTAYCAYIAGDTGADNFPTVNSYQSSYGGGYDGFVSKFSSSGSNFLYSTYLGGSAGEYVKSIAVDSTFYAYVAGYSGSQNFPTANPYQSSNGGGNDGFVTKLSSSGTTLIYSTYLGGNSGDVCRDIDLDSQNQVYVCGEVASSNFPTLNPYQASNAVPVDGFVTQFSTSGSSLIYSTYLGGSAGDGVNSLTLDSNLGVYIAGATGSLDFPTINAYQTSRDPIWGDAFAAKLKFTTPTPTPTPTPYDYKTPTPTPTTSPTPEGYKTPTPTPSPPALDEGFDNFHTGTRPAGWTFINCNSNSDTYTAEGNYGKALPSLKLDATGDKVITKTFSQPDDLYFWIKGQGVDPTSALLVEEYYIPSWNTITEINNLPATGTTEGPFALNNSTVQLQFTYNKSVGNLAFDDVRVTAHTPTPTPVGYKTPIPAPTPDGGKRIAITPVTGSTLSPPSTPSAASEPTAVPIEELLLADLGDYDGDGTVDPAVFRPASGLWSIKGLTRLYFGISPAGVRPLSPSTYSSGSDPYPGDLPASGDYDGDGTADIAIFRPTSGLWSVRDVTRDYFGLAGDGPIPGDYDGDGVCDLAVFRSATGLWALRGLTNLYFGGSSDVAVPGDYDGDGAADIGIFRSSAGLWKVRGLTLFYFGGGGDIAVPGDYDGSGSLTAGIFRPASGLWAIRGITRLYFGTAEDQLVPGDYDGDLVDDIAIFRPKTGLWAVEGVTRAYLGP